MLNYFEIQQSLIRWFKDNKRDLPWRKNRTWYKVWISEIMLQQTQVEQVVDYYQKFLKEFPSVQVLANADLQKVLKIWEGLGYYSRARNLHKTAQIIVNQFKCKFPSAKSNIIKLPGIGEYTANAILSFVYNEPFSVVDGNVIRVITRLFGITDNIRETKTLKKIKSKTDKLMPPKDSANYNEAVMELGALICLPNNPICDKCPANKYCESRKDNLSNIIPFKSKNAAKSLVTVVVQIVKKNNKYCIVKRKDHGLLGGYWEFPYKTIDNIDKQMIDSTVIKFDGIKHSYTHFNLLMYPILVKESELQVKNSLYIDYKWLTLKDVRKLPIHKAMQKVLKVIENN
jgi:A/G-specific adenine glycosylase